MSLSRSAHTLGFCLHVLTLKRIAAGRVQNSDRHRETTAVSLAAAFGRASHDEKTLLFQRLTDLVGIWSWRQNLVSQWQSRDFM